MSELNASIDPEARSLLETYPDPAILLDRSYRIVVANQAYRRRYGGGHETPTVDHCYAASHGYSVPCDEAGEECPLRRCLETGRRNRVLHVHHGPDGPSHVDVVMHPLRDRNGEITRFLEVMHETPAASPTPDGAGLVGRSAAFNRMLELVRRVAATEVAVLLLGESGTGKELVAKAIHDESERHGGPFVPVECSGLTESLFESELFGHEKGAFTGAQHRKQGLVEAARGGTLFLDEVGDIPPALQVKLLRLLETRTFRPVGSVETRKADFRVVCATHQDLETHVTGGRFRADLYYRLATFPIRMPPLRERPEDLPLLAETLLGRFPPGQGKALTPEARERLGAYTFPGNIRELRNILERAAILADDTEIRPEHLTELSEQRTGVRATPGPSMPLPAELRPLQEVEDRYLPWAAAYAGGMDRGELATRLGLSERTLYRRLREARARSEAPETPRHAAAEGGGDALNSDPTGPEGPS